MERIHTVLQGSENICQIFFMSLNFPKIKYNVCVIVSCRLDLALTEITFRSDIRYLEMWKMVC